MKKMLMSFLFAGIICCMFLNFNSTTINAEVNVSVVGDNVSSYYVDKIVEDVELDFGVRFHNDFAYLKTSDENYVMPGTYAAGGKAYGEEPFVLDKYYTANVNVLEIPSVDDVDIVPYANIQGASWKLTTVAQMITGFEATHPNKKVIAAVNGDFFDINANSNYPYTSTGGTVSEGNYFKVNSDWKHIAFMNNGSTKSMVGNIFPQVSEKPVLQIIENDEIVFEVDVDGINKNPGVGETTCYFAFYDTNHKPIEQDVDNAYFVVGERVVPFSEKSVYGKGQIKAIGNGRVDGTTFAISTTNNVLREYLKENATVRVQYEYVGELEGVDSLVGYAANIIVEGEPVIERNYRHPRTMAGVREDGTIMLVTIDGRQIDKGYYGASPTEQAALMQYYGCVQAYNLDGGGSTTTIIKQNGKFVVKNSPSDGEERHDANCLLIVADVPSIDISLSNITSNSFDIKLDVVEIIDKYKELYIDVNGEKRKVTNGVMSYTGLDPFTDYVYKIYALVEDEYVGLPYTGIVNTAKEKFIIESTCLEKVIMNDQEYYKFTYSLLDDYETVLFMYLRVDGKRITIDKGEAYILASNGCPINKIELVITYNVSDGSGRQDQAFKDFALTFTDADTAVNSIADVIDSFVKGILD